MIHIAVAVGRFCEILLWEMAQATALVALGVAGAAALAIGCYRLAKRALAKARAAG